MKLPYLFLSLIAVAVNAAQVVHAQESTNTATPKSDQLQVVARVTAQGSGDGLTGEYFEKCDLRTSKFTRIDRTINFNWGSGSPDPRIAEDFFSVRWTGQIEPLYSETYTLHIKGDNGRRVWINDQLIIDRWTNTSISDSASIDLTKGQKADIVIEYCELQYEASLKIEWESASQKREIIPQRQLYSSPVRGTGDGLKAEYFASSPLKMQGFKGLCCAD